ncbi:MAG: hypothetical protein L6R36_007926 [Xanthoria steineri]|nr:MAG: hypothetical protein L6R36_007926 [Xanthoria steineri]
MDDSQESSTMVASSTDGIDNLLERREYARWKTLKRGNKRFERGYKSIEKRAFELRLHYGRRWISQSSRMRLRKKAKSQPLTDRTIMYQRLGGPSQVPSRRDAHEVSDDYVKRYKTKYLADFQRSDDASELKEPDWACTDRESVHITINF